MSARASPASDLKIVTRYGVGFDNIDVAALTRRGIPLALMKPSALLINAARGGLVDEFALADALAGGRLAGAGLDVLAAEPPPPDHPLLRSDKVVVSPHAAALTRECAVRMSEVCAANVLDAFAGRLDRNRVVNVETLAR